jgi:hypothetical protein
MILSMNKKGHGIETTLNFHRKKNIKYRNNINIIKKKIEIVKKYGNNII